MAMKIDAHQHFWIFDQERDVWINDAMHAIRRDFLPQHLKPELENKLFDGCVAVQADQSPQETQFLLDLSKKHPWIKKVVGWVELESPDIEDQLVNYAQNKKLAGFRKILQNLPPEAMEDAGYIRGLSKLAKFDFTYDILIYPQHLEKAIDLVQKFPNQSFILDHLAKPNIKNGLFDKWSKDISEMSELENVYCKVSGMVTEADWTGWKYEDYIPYLDHITACFGVERLVYGSDWPVCLVAASYEEVYDIAATYFSHFSEEEQAAIFGENACRFYGIDKE